VAREGFVDVLLNAEFFIFQVACHIFGIFTQRSFQIQHQMWRMGE
jgi:hypothetical protein